jgi:Holliday junction DNA helicase RuvB
MVIKKEQRIVTPKLKKEEIKLDTSLRPKRLSEFVGQDKIKENIKILIEAARKRKEPLDHVLLYGPAGLGKTTLAQVIAREINCNIKITSGPSIDRAGDLASILTNLEDKDILFIDEIHRLNRTVEEILYSAMEDYALDIIVGKGPAAKTLRLDLPKFAVIGATIRFGSLTTPLRDRFGSHFRLDFYKTKDLKKIIVRSAKVLKIEIENAAAWTIARCARKTPRVANRLLKRIRDYAEVKGNGIITDEITHKSLKMLEIDQMGLDSADRKLMETIIRKFSGGPVGLETLAACIGEDVTNIEDVYEPYLMRLGFIKRTPRGRMVTSNGFDYLGFPQPVDDHEKKQRIVVSKDQKKLL